MFKNNFFAILILIIFCFIGAPDSLAQSTTIDGIEKAVAGMKLRAIGPAFMGGRIADIAVHINDPSTWYVAVGSGGVWKTENAGTTWSTIFDDQSVFPITARSILPRSQGSKPLQILIDSHGFATELEP